MAFIAILFTPLYIRNLKLQNFVDRMTRRVGNDKQTDEELVGLVLEKAHQLDLPVTDSNVHVFRSPEGLRIDVRYVVTVQAPLYQVVLHFYPGAGSR